ncbi:MAG: phenylalanine--tRNA ligase subunit beta, partial [Clostridia bacterium]|nr:phenylalanine--tRNA ligase subunit beta [Clostridia bacterium]
MKLSKKWLNDYVQIDVPEREYAEKMTMSGSKVEGWEQTCGELKRVVVGRVLSVERHPDADKLVVCKVDAGEAEPIQIVTAATNVTVGAAVPVALHKSTLHCGKTIERGKLRGVVSDGMFCSVAELGVTVHDF